jgi:hypothetical protein
MSRLVQNSDASPYGLGAILTPRQKSSEFRPGAYASRILTPVQEDIRKQSVKFLVNW